MIYHSKSLVLVRKGRAFYETLYQGCFFLIQGGGTSLILHSYTSVRFIFVSISHIFNFIYCLFYFIINKNQKSILCMHCPSFTRIWVCIVFLSSSLKASFFLSKDNGPFSPSTPSTIDFFIKYFGYLITHECDLSFGSMSSLDIQTPAFVFLQFGGWQGDSGPLGGLPAPKTTTETTLTNTATTTMPMPNIAGR